MNLRVIEFPPKESTGIKIAVNGPVKTVRENFGDAQFLRSWLEFDAGMNELDFRHGTNWYAILGILLTLAVSVGFWAGLGWLVTR